MKLFDLIQLAINGFKSRKSRIIFTVLSVAIGISAVLFLVALGLGLQRNLLDRITTEESLLSLDIVSAETRFISITPDVIKELSAIPVVDKIAPHAIFPATVSLAERVGSETTLNLISPDWLRLEGIVPEIGRGIEEGDKNKVVVNSTIVTLFDLTPEEFLGKKLTITLFIQKDKDTAEVSIFNPEKEFEVVGIINEQGISSQIYLQRSDLPDLQIDEYQFAKVKVEDGQYLEEVRERLISMGFLVSALSDTITQANKIFRVIQIVLGIFGVIALIVAAIGLVNTMTITLLQRTSEIGIMRAIGASPKDIKRLFLGESVITGFLGGVSGIIIGVITSQVFNWIVNILARVLGGKPVQLFYYPFWFIIFIVLLSGLVGLLAGFWPARRASKLNPLEALRYK